MVKNRLVGVTILKRRNKNTPPGTAIGAVLLEEKRWT
jgi:hypothetical protein